MSNLLKITQVDYIRLASGVMNEKEIDSAVRQNDCGSLIDRQSRVQTVSTWEKYD